MGLIESTLQERGNRYGTFLENALISQRLKQIAETHPRWDYMRADQRECIHNIFAKISRIITGDPTYVDNWTDIEGYARLVREALEKDQDRERKEDLLTSIIVDFIYPDDASGDGPQDCQDGNT